MCVLKEEWLYNLAGSKNEWSVARISLVRGREGTQWQQVLLRGGPTRAGWLGYGIHAISNRIYFFGSYK